MVDTHSTNDVAFDKNVVGYIFFFAVGIYKLLIFYFGFKNLNLYDVMLTYIITFMTALAEV